MNKEPSQLGVEVTRQLAEIREKSEKEKIPLSKEVAEYTRENLRKVQEKLAKGEPVYPSDMEFIGKVKLWIVEMSEAPRRGISQNQWQALLHMASVWAKTGKEKEYIDAHFGFPGNSKIEFASGSLTLNGLVDLKFLPDNLKVAGDLDLSGCKSLTSLPNELEVGGILNLSNCTGLASLPGDLMVKGRLILSNKLDDQVKRDAERLKTEGKINGNIMYMPF